MLVVEFMPEVVIGVVFSFYDDHVNALFKNVIMSVYVECSNLCSYGTLNHVWPNRK